MSINTAKLVRWVQEQVVKEAACSTNLDSQYSSADEFIIIPFVTTPNSRINARSCSPILWFIFNVQKMQKIKFRNT
jgi:hypothetical protein